VARLTKSEQGAIATLAGLGTAATGAVVYLASTAPDGRGQRAAHVATAEAERSHDRELPFALNLEAVAAVALLLAVLALWGWWQNRNRCQSCGHCPAWCRCHELAGGH
jgi:hypothetical protein